MIGYDEEHPASPALALNRLAAGRGCLARTPCPTQVRTCILQHFSVWSPIQGRQSTEARWTPPGAQRPICCRYRPAHPGSPLARQLIITNSLKRSQLHPTLIPRKPPHANVQMDGWFSDATTASGQSRASTSSGPHLLKLIDGRLWSILYKTQPGVLERQSAWKSRT